MSGATAEPTEVQIRQRAFRNALGSFPTGVTIITTQDPDDGRLTGITVNSFSSVSLAPPLVLWSLARKSPNIDQFAVGRQHAIHVLSQIQKDLAYHFAAPKPDKFAGVEHALEAGFKAPILPHSTACFYCETDQILDGGDHLIVLARVLRHETTDHSPLLFAKGTMMNWPTAA
ncbi:MAG: flavin reductase family protein [Alphaproteobacteria bacterium]|nr:flavin reductase family protein [Alphaproteobacteria bacterium]